MTAGHERLTSDGLQAQGYGWLFDATFLSHFDADEYDDVLDHMFWRRYDPGDDFVVDGVVPRGIDLLVKGHAEVIVRCPSGASRVLATLGTADMIGERSLSLDCKAGATVRATQPCLSLHMPAQAFKSLLEQSPRFAEYVRKLVELRQNSDQYKNRWLREGTVRIMGQPGIETLLRTGRIESFDSGETILRAGELTRHVYVVLDGEVRLALPSSGDKRRKTKEKTLSEHGSGWLFGHAAVLYGAPRSASIYAASEKVDLLRLSGEAFMDIVQRSPTLKRKLYEEFARQGVRTDGYVGAHTRKASVVSVFGAEGAKGITSVAYGLAAGLASYHTRVALIDVAGTRVARRHPVFRTEDVTIGGVSMGRLIPPGRSAVEIYFPHVTAQAHDVVAAVRESLPPEAFVLVASASRGPVDCEVRRAAQQIVFVRRAKDTAYELAEDQHQHRVDAVRLDTPVDIPFDAAAHIIRIPEDQRTVDRFWVGGDLEALSRDVSPFGAASRPLARKLLGRTVGVALGGGGALGFAHIGLLRVLEEAGIPIDYIAGASFGALVAGFYAAGGMRAVEMLVSDRRSLVALLMSGFLSTKGLERWVDHKLGVIHPGMTPIPFFPVGVDLETGRQVVWNNGTIGQGVRSSSCLPGAFPSWRHGSRRIVDGGIHNNVPASVPWRAGADFIIASNIIPEFPFGPSRRPKTLSGKILQRSTGRLDEVVRSLFLLMSQAGRDRAEMADFVFDLNLQGFNIYDFIRGDQIAVAGEEQASDLLAFIDDFYAEKSVKAFKRRTTG